MEHSVPEQQNILTTLYEFLMNLRKKVLIKFEESLNKIPKT